MTLPRHCERSEAIQTFTAVTLWIASAFVSHELRRTSRRDAPRNDESVSRFGFQATGDSRSHSRGAFARVVLKAPPSDTAEGAGKAGCPLHPRPTRKKVFARARVDHRYRRNHSGLPCAVVYDLLRALPGEPACCHRHLRKARCLLENLAPAWARQDHTTWSSAAMSLVWRHRHVHRIPPRVRDGASAPRAEAGRADHTPDSTF